MIDSLAENAARAPLLLRSLFEVDYAEPADQASHTVLQRALARVASGLEDGMARGGLRRVPVQHTAQTLIGMTVFHFATGDFGAELLGANVNDFVEPALCVRSD